MAAEEVEQRVMASNVYQCTACAREFKDKSQLTKHFNMEHSKVSRKYDWQQSKTNCYLIAMDVAIFCYS